MSERHEPPAEDELSADELATHEATELPARQAMSAIGDIAIPLNPDMAAEVLLAGVLDPSAPDDPGAEN